MKSLEIYKCVYCSGEIEEKSQRCPWCGYWFEKQPDLRVWNHLSIVFGSDTVKVPVAGAEWSVSEPVKYRGILTTELPIYWAMKTETLAEFSQARKYFDTLRGRRTEPCEIHIDSEFIADNGFLETISLESRPGHGLMTCLFRGATHVNCRFI